MLDFESICLIGGVFIISAATLFIIDYLFKNKSYEEAVAEQRQQNSALYNSQRPKPKEKKQKKNNKKVKEKKSSKEKETDSFDDSENQTSDGGESHKNHHHVEFTETTVIEESTKEPAVKRKQKKDAVRPILVNRDSSTENIQRNVESVAPANHFEELHPKDEFELLNSHKEDSPKESPIRRGKKQNIENEPPKLQKLEVQKNKKSPKPQNNEVKKPVDVVDRPMAVEPVIEVPIVASGSTASSANPPTKDKKKKKSEISTLQLLAGDKSHEVNISILMPLVRKAEMSRDEVQILIDMLLNKQQDAPVIDEWSEGKADPVQKLKKQLVDKEKQVIELQESLSGSQSKLREVRSEVTAEKALLQQSVREAQENMNRCNIERQALETKIQNVSLQNKQFSDEHRKMMEEYANLQIKHQQLELHLAQKQDSDMKINQLHSEIQEYQSHRAIMEQKFGEELEKSKIKISELIDINGKLEQNLAVGLKQQDDDSKIEMSKLNHELQRTAEEVMRLQQEKKQELMQFHKQKQDFDVSIGKLTAEMNSYKNDIMRMKDEHIAMNDEKNKLLNEMSSLQLENGKLVDRISNVAGEASSSNDEKIKLREEITKLKNEITSLRSENGKLADRVANVSEEVSTSNDEKAKLLEDNSRRQMENNKLEKEIATVTEEKLKLQQEKNGQAEEINKLTKESAEFKGLKSKLETDYSKLEVQNKKLQASVAALCEEKKGLEEKSSGLLESSELQIRQLNAELATVKSSLQEMEQSYKEQMEAATQHLQKQVEEQRNKNNDLRQKNWKVMEALNAAESRTKAQEKQPIHDLDNMITNARAEERQASKVFVQRFFPSIQVPLCLPQEKWEEQMSKAIEEHLQTMKTTADQSPEVTKLTLKISEYKKIIDETEGMLSMLQKHIEIEEIRWRKELRNKDELIEKLEGESQLQDTLEDYKKKLNEERENKKKLMEEISKMQNEKILDLSKQLESQVMKQRINLEKNIEVNNVPIKSQNHNNPTNGPIPTMSNDQTLSPASSAASSISEVSVKKNKKKKKKNNGK